MKFIYSLLILFLTINSFAANVRGFQQGNHIVFEIQGEEEVSIYKINGEEVPSICSILKDIYPIEGINEYYIVDNFRSIETLYVNFSKDSYADIAYPNPFNSEITVRKYSNDPVHLINIVTNQEYICYDNVISTLDFPSGIYYIRVGNRQQKIIKQ